VFDATSTLAGGRRHRPRPDLTLSHIGLSHIGLSHIGVPDIGWRVPLWCSALAGASVWAIVGTGGGLVFAAVLALTVVAAGWWGTPPWPSRIARVLTPSPPRHVDRVAVGAALAAVALVALGPASFHGDALLVCVWLGVAAGEAAVVMTAWGVRQWRFVAAARRRALGTLIAVALALVLGAPELATTDVRVAAPALAAVLMMVTIALARVPSRRVRETVDAERSSR
jgi:hypothetical protein